MKRLTQLLTFIFLLFASSAFAQEATDFLRLGQQASDVKEIMGEPTRVEPLTKSTDKVQAALWWYGDNQFVHLYDAKVINVVLDVTAYKVKIEQANQAKKANNETRYQEIMQQLEADKAQFKDKAE